VLKLLYSKEIAYRSCAVEKGQPSVFSEWL